MLDVDGTLVHRAGEEVHVQPGAREVLSTDPRVRAPARASSRTAAICAPEGFAAGLRAVGLDIADDEMLTPLRSVQSYLRAQRRDGPVLLFGTDGGREYLLRCRRERARRGRRRRRRLRVRRARRPGGLHRARAGGPRRARRRAAPHRQLRAGLRRSGRADPEPRCDGHGRDREGVERAAGHRRQAVAGRAADDHRAARSAVAASWS